MKWNAWLNGMRFRDFVKETVKELSDDSIPDTAAQLSYYFLFSLFPFLFTLVTLAAYLPLRHSLHELIDRLEDVMPADAYSVVHDHMSTLLSSERPQLLTVGAGVALWTASRGVDAFRKALNLAYDVKESRSFLRVNLLAIGMTIAGALLMLLGITFMVMGGEAGGWLASRIGISQGWAVAWSVMRWPLTALAVMLAIALTYYVLPDVEQKFRFITPGSVLGTLSWLGATYGFTAYVEQFGKYNVTYGSIGSVIVLMLWFYITGLIFLMGGEINAVLERHAPLGKARGAREFGETPPPIHERPSYSPVGAAKTAKTAERAPSTNTPPPAPPRPRRKIGWATLGFAALMLLRGKRTT